MKNQVALNAYELDVFSIAGLKGLCPPSQISGGLGGSAPQPKKKKIEKNSIFRFLFNRFLDFFEKNDFQKVTCLELKVTHV